MTKRAYLWTRRASALAERLPAAYRLSLIARHRNSPFLRRIVTPGHDLVIEGVPRSASSFAVRAFMMANGWRDPRVATHVHSPAQVVLAARWGVPVILTIRPPEAAVVGWMAYAAQTGQIPAIGLSRRKKIAWLRSQMARYARFYETTTPLAAHYVLAPFEETTRDFGAILDRVNAKFGCDFERFDHSPDNVRRIFARSEAHLSPNAARDALKSEVSALYHAPANARLRARAERAYRAAMAGQGAVPDGRRSQGAPRDAAVSGV